LSEDTVLWLNCTGTRHLIPNVVINEVLISSIHATNLLTNVSIEESVLRDSTGRLVLSFKISITSDTRLTFECDRSSNYCYKSCIPADSAYAARFSCLSLGDLFHILCVGVVLAIDNN